MGYGQRAGRPRKTPDREEDTDLDRRDHLAGRLPDGTEWLRRCADWIRQLDGDATRRWSTCARPAAGRTVPSMPSAWRGCGRSSIARLPTWMNSGPGRGPGHRGGVTRPAGGTPPAAGRAGPGVPGLLRPQSAARFMDSATGAGLWEAWQAKRYRRDDINQTRFDGRHNRVRGSHFPGAAVQYRAAAAAREREAAREVHRQPVPAMLTATPVPRRRPGQFRRLDAVAVLPARLLPAAHLVLIGSTTWCTAGPALLLASSGRAGGSDGAWSGSGTPIRPRISRKSAASAVGPQRCVAIAVAVELVGDDLAAGLAPGVQGEGEQRDAEHDAGGQAGGAGQGKGG